MSARPDIGPPDSGRAWVFGDGIDTDVLAPGSLMKLPPEELAKHCLAAVDARFAAEVRPGDVVVGGRSFGIGSSREQAAISLKLLGVRAVLAESFARIFWRNAMNIGLPVLFFPLAREVAGGDLLRVDPAGGLVENLTQGRRYPVQPLPSHLLDIIGAGGLMPYLKQRTGRAA